MSESAPERIQIDKVLDTAFAENAHHIHLDAGQPVRVRINGEMTPYDDSRVLESEDMVGFMKSLTPERSKQTLQEKGHVTFAFGYFTLGRVRAALHKGRGDISMDLKLVPPVITPKELGLPDDVQKMTRSGPGLVILSSQVGHGRSGMLNALVGDLGREAGKRIMLVGEPAEAIHTPGKSTISQIEVGSDIDTLAEAVNTAIRGNYDVIAIDKDINDPEVAHATANAAQSGVLVLVTRRSMDHESLLQPEKSLSGLSDKDYDRIKGVLQGAFIGSIRQEIHHDKREARLYLADRIKNAAQISAPIAGNWAPPVYNGQG